MSRREYVNANRIQADAPDSIVITVRKGDTVSAGDLDIQKQNTLDLHPRITDKIERINL